VDNEVATTGLQHYQRQLGNPSVARCHRESTGESEVTKDNRGGVYYEAGFAKGLGHEVIWTVREDHLDDVHFDTRQYNFLRWQTNDLPGFAKALQNRIEATIGKGPL
jgi:hypothetical protein